jgi:tellurite resistance protein TerC
MWLKTLQRAKRLIRIVVGFTVLALGVALLVLPGPGILIIAVGLAILSAEFVWARRLLDRLKAQAQAARDAFEGRRPG